MTPKGRYVFRSPLFANIEGMRFLDPENDPQTPNGILVMRAHVDGEMRYFPVFFEKHQDKVGSGVYKAAAYGALTDDALPTIGFLEGDTYRIVTDSHDLLIRAAPQAAA